MPILRLIALCTPWGRRDRRRCIYWQMCIFPVMYVPLFFVPRGHVRLISGLFLSVTIHGGNRVWMIDGSSLPPTRLLTIGPSFHRRRHHPAILLWHGFYLLVVYNLAICMTFHVPSPIVGPFLWRDHRRHFLPRCASYSHRSRFDQVVGFRNCITLPILLSSPLGVLKSFSAWDMIADQPTVLHMFRVKLLPDRL